MATKTFQIEQLPPQYTAFYQQYIDSAYRAFDLLREVGQASPSGARLKFKFAANRVFNAHASSSGDEHSVVVNIAVPVIIHFACNHLLQIPSLLPQIGAPSAETTQTVFSKGIPMALPDVPFAESIPTIIGGSRPIDDARAAAASLITQFAVSFCLFHEIAHVACGHTRRAPGRLSEFSGLRAHWPWPRRPSLSHVWEFEADLNAGYMMASTLLHGSNQAFYESILAPGGSSTPQECVIAAACIALWSTFSLVHHSGGQPRRSSSHPAPLVRLFSVMDELASGSALFSHLPAHRFEEILTASLSSADLAWSQLTGTQPLVDQTRILDGARQEQAKLIAELHVRHGEYAENAWGISHFPDLATPRKPSHGK